MKKRLNCYRCNKFLEEGEGIESATLENEKTEIFCNECYGKESIEKTRRGRPSLGKTAKISLTISEGEWTILDSMAGGNRSKYIRNLVLNDIDSKVLKLPKLYFKNDDHEKLLFHYSSLMGIKFTDESAYAGCYILASLVYKRFDDFIVKGKHLKVRSLQKEIGAYSTTEKNMIRFAIQLISGPNADGIPLVNVFNFLDDSNTRVIKSAINYVYR